MKKVTRQHERAALYELLDAAVDMFGGGATQDGKQFHFDWDRANRLRKASIVAFLIRSQVNEKRTNAARNK